MARSNKVTSAQPTSKDMGCRASALELVGQPGETQVVRLSPQTHQLLKEEAFRRRVSLKSLTEAIVKDWLTVNAKAAA